MERKQIARQRRALPAALTPAEIEDGEEVEDTPLAIVRLPRRQTMLSREITTRRKHSRARPHAGSLPTCSVCPRQGNDYRPAELFQHQQL